MSTLPPGIRTIFKAVVLTAVPESSSLATSDWHEVEGIVARALAERPKALRRQLTIFLWLLDILPIVRYGRAFTTLDAATRTRVLGALSDAPLLVVRRGVWGARTLAFMGFYGRPAATTAIGYRASARGWAAR